MGAGGDWMGHSLPGTPPPLPSTWDNARQGHFLDAEAELDLEIRGEKTQKAASPLSSGVGSERSQLYRAAVLRKAARCPAGRRPDLCLHGCSLVRCRDCCVW